MCPSLIYSCAYHSHGSIQIKQNSQIGYMLLIPNAIAIVMIIPIIYTKTLYFIFVLKCRLPPVATHRAVVIATVTALVCCSNWYLFKWSVQNWDILQCFHRLLLGHGTGSVKVGQSIINTDTWSPYTSHVSFLKHVNCYGTLQQHAVVYDQTPWKEI